MPPKTKTVRVPVRGGPEMKTYWVETQVPVLKKRDGVPPPPEEPTPPKVPAQASKKWDPNLPVISVDDD